MAVVLNERRRRPTDETCPGAMGRSPLVLGERRVGSWAHEALAALERAAGILHKGYRVRCSMKIRTTLKDPDGLREGIEACVADSLRKSHLRGDEYEDAVARKTAEEWKKLEKWVESQDYVTLEFDTTAGTAIVVPCRRKTQAARQ